MSALLALGGTALAAPTVAVTGMPEATDTTSVRIGVGGSNFAGCYYGGADYRVDGGPWITDMHPVRSFLHLTPALGVKRVDFRVSDSCTGEVSPTLSRSIRLVAPGVLDPRITSLTTPSTTATATISVKLAATKGAYDASAVRSIRFATESGDWGAWLPYTTSLAAPVSTGTGAKGLYVQVADGLRESKPLFRRFTRVAKSAPAAPRPVTPVLHDVTVASHSSGTSIGAVIRASDDVRVTRVRFATEAGNWGAWTTFHRASVAAPATGGSGYRGLYVQVADAGNRTSAILYRRYTSVAATTSSLRLNDHSVTFSSDRRTVTGILDVRRPETSTGALQIRAAGPDGAWTAWAPVSADLTFSITRAAAFAPTLLTPTLQVRDSVSGMTSNFSG